MEQRRRGTRGRGSKGKPLDTNDHKGRLIRLRQLSDKFEKAGNTKDAQKMRNRINPLVEKSHKEKYLGYDKATRQPAFGKSAKGRNLANKD